MDASLIWNNQLRRQILKPIKPEQGKDYSVRGSRDMEGIRISPPCVYGHNSGRLLNVVYQAVLESSLR